MRASLLPSFVLSLAFTGCTAVKVASPLGVTTSENAQHVWVFVEGTGGIATGVYRCRDDRIPNQTELAPVCVRAQIREGTR